MHVAITENTYNPRATQLSSIPLGLIDQISSTIEKYQLFSQKGRIGVAFSGGKDSLFTLIALRELEYNVIPLIIDMGYEKDWGDKIVSLATQIGFDNAVVLNPRQLSSLPIVETTQQKIRDNLNTLSNQHLFQDKILSPCTFCYNTKAILLENYALSHDLEVIVFGQHALDAIASLMKLALMYIDRWDYHNERFNHARYSQLVDDLLLEFVEQDKDIVKGGFFSRLKELCENSLASTDDPPLQILNSSGQGVKLTRPIFSIRESEIINYINLNNLTPEGSGCGHGATKETQTPREMIHYRILRFVDSHPNADLIIEHLMNLVERGLTPQGELKLNVRNARSSLLGPTYKAVRDCQDQKV